MKLFNFSLGGIVLFFVFLTFMNVNLSKTILGVFFDLKGEIVEISTTNATGADKIANAVEIKN